MKAIALTFCILFTTISINAQSISSWNVNGNSILPTYFLGTTNSQDLNFKRNNIVSGSIQSNNTSFGYFAFESNVNSTGNSSFGVMSLQNLTFGLDNTAMGTSSLNNITTGLGNSGFGSWSGTGTTTGDYNTFVGYGTGGGITTGSNNTIIGAQITGLQPNLSGHVILADGNGNIRIHINNQGKVKIGDVSTPGNYKLYVEQGILTEKVKVALKNTTEWADHVFEEDYALMPLSDVEKFINENKHLPGISSAETLVEEGIDLGAMQARLLEKIEELTLYIIDMKKEMDLLKNIIYNDEK